MTPATRLRATDSLERCPAAADKISLWALPRTESPSKRAGPCNNNTTTRRRTEERCVLSRAIPPPSVQLSMVAPSWSVALDGAFVLYGCVLCPACV